jgi:hypothetical protein
MKAILVLLILTFALVGCTSMPPVDTVAKRYEVQYPDRKIVKVEAFDEHELEGKRASYRIYYTSAGSAETKTDIWRYQLDDNGWAPIP